jgi:hypothetical protein
MNRRRSSVQYAVEGAIESNQFRPETGLSSGFDRGRGEAREHERQNMTRRQSDSGSLGDSHLSTYRSRLGSRLPSTPDIIKEEL